MLKGFMLIKKKRVMRNYLGNRQQRTRINKIFSDWSALCQGASRSLVLGPIFFYIFLNDLFFILKDLDICNFANDATPHVCDISLNELLMRLLHDFALAVCQSECIYANLNTEKCHLIIFGYEHEDYDKIQETIEYGGQTASSLLG